MRFVRLWVDFLTDFHLFLINTWFPPATYHWELPSHSDGDSLEVDDLTHPFDRPAVSAKNFRIKKSVEGCWLLFPCLKKVVEESPGVFATCVNYTNQVI